MKDFKLRKYTVLFVFEQEHSGHRMEASRVRSEGLMQMSWQDMRVVWTAVDKKKWTDLRVNDLRVGHYRS